jgi:drug/metabolite transporter (DMT)-like permease
MIAASLWAVDALLRGSLVQTMPPAAIVFYEHFIGFIILIPLFIRYLPKFKQLTSRDWGVLVGLTVVSSALGSLLFTEALKRSFTLSDFATPILLLKLQPIFVIVLAWVFLKEKLTTRFLLLVPVALFGSYLISFGWHKVPLTLTNHAVVYLLSIGATFAWGTGTILSKAVLKKLSFSEATVIRYALAVPVTAIFVLGLKQNYSVSQIELGQIFRLVIIAFTTGAAAIFVYYKGLQRTEAKVSTIAELMYPIISILIAITALNPFSNVPQVLSRANVIGIVILLAAILKISIDYAKVIPNVE